MRVKCDYCGSVYEDNLDECPSCGASNSKRNAGDKRPRTISELQDWYKARNLPPSNVTRFFIGEDIKSPKAFGIYQNEYGDFVVYKNKADGTRAIRYQGCDEEYAVNELYQKLKDEIVHQKYGASKQKSQFFSTNKTRPWKVKLLLYGIMSWILLTIFIPVIANRHNGYYDYNGHQYYKYQSHWYSYEPVDCYDIYGDYSFTTDSWVEIDGNVSTDSIEDNYDDYYVSRNWDSSIGASDWNDSGYYDDFHSDSSSSDSSYDWDSGSSWDSGGTDWDSDW